MTQQSLKHLLLKNMSKKYRIEYLATTGWDMYDIKYTKMTKEETREKLRYLMEQGENPNNLRAVPDV